MRCYAPMPVFAVEVFTLIVTVGVLGLLVVFLLLGAFYPGSGAEQLQWRPTRSPELEVQNDIDDLQQMFDAANERRRKRGRPELTLADVEQTTNDFKREQLARAETYLADDEVEQMLEAKNARRARKGQAPLTREQYEASLRGEAGPSTGSA